MSYSIIPTLKFKKQVNRLIKKYPSLISELKELESQLAENLKAGTALGNNVFKVRLAVKSKGKGKSGGMRIITFVITEDTEIYLLTIYDKSEISSVGTDDLSVLVKEIKKGKGV